MESANCESQRSSLEQLACRIAYVIPDLPERMTVETEIDGEKILRRITRERKELSGNFVRAYDVKICDSTGVLLIGIHYTTSDNDTHSLTVPGRLTISVGMDRRQRILRVSDNNREIIMPEGITKEHIAKISAFLQGAATQYRAEEEAKDKEALEAVAKHITAIRRLIDTL